MKKLHGNSLILGATAMIFLAAQSVSAQMTQITDVQLNPVDGGISVVLKTNSGDRPQVFTTQKGNALIADIINTQLRLSKGNSFHQNNPAPGIASVAIAQLDANSIRVLVTGIDSAPSSQPVVRKQNGIALNFTPTAVGKTPTPQLSQAAAQPMAGKMPTLQSSQAAAQPMAGKMPTPQVATPSQLSQKPDVLVPNPQITIDGKPAPAAGPSQPMTPTPPFLPRAVAPPVGDIAISNMDASASSIDLGTQERVPRLVLRDAPVREVLSLLARAASLNLAYTGNGAAAPSGGQGQGAAAATGDGPTISLDIENEPVQDVFNYVLRLSGLQANRSGRTIFVGPNLPNATRDLVMRNLRLNQVTVGVALNFLVGLGAESAVSRERQVTSVSAVPVGNVATAITQTQTTTENRLETQRANFTDSTPLLRGLQALGDERSNSITLIGTPRLVEMAMAQITQLDIRRRQVAVNVKVVDVNLSGIQDFNSSFAFGIGNNYFSNDGGAASLNFGGVKPPSAAQATNSLVNPTVIPNPYAGGNTFVDLNNSTNVPGTGIGERTVFNNTVNGQFNVNEQLGRAEPFFNRQAGVSGNPFQTITDITQGTPNVTTTTVSPSNTPGGPNTVTTTLKPGTLGTVTGALPSFFQYPKRLLASLQAQVQSGNAKILTDPTLIVQEGQQALVNLTQEVVGNIKIQTTDTPGGTRTERIVDKQRVGLTLNVRIERIDDNGFVALSVAPTVSSPAQAQDTGNGQIVLVSERSLTSGLIRLRDGQTLILSGIIQDQDRTTVSKIPILGDIPLLGSLFRKTNRSNQRQEVIVLLTPQIMDDSERSSFGYNYSPSPEVRQMIERRGLQVPAKR